jgi:hypothetical protein
MALPDVACPGLLQKPLDTAIGQLRAPSDMHTPVFFELFIVNLRNRLGVDTKAPLFISGNDISNKREGLH